MKRRSKVYTNERPTEPIVLPLWCYGPVRIIPPQTTYDWEPLPKEVK